MFRSRITSLTTLFAFILLAVLVFTPQAHATPRQYTLVLDQLTEVEDDEDVEDWDSDVLNLTVNDPGVILIEGRRADLVGLASTESICGSTRSLAASWLPTTQGRRAVTVRPGTYNVEIQPHGVSWIQHQLRFKLKGYCPGSDDHDEGDLCATQLCLGTAEDGDIETSGDIDSFSFYLASADTVTIESTGSTDVDAELFDEDGTLVASDEDSGSGVNFQMVESLAAGRYFVRVRGYGTATGVYDVSVD